VRRVANGKRVATAEGTFTVNGKAANGKGSIYREREWHLAGDLPGARRRPSAPSSRPHA
jgi:hypothetical protein